MQKFTIRPTLWNYKKNVKEIYPVKIAVTVDRRVTYILTGYKVHIKQWNDANKTVVRHENANLINVSIRRKIAEIERSLIENAMSGVTLSKRVIKGDAIINKPFKDYATEIEYNPTMINRVKEFSGDQLMISDITVEWLRKFEEWCRLKPLAQNTLNITFKYVGRIVRQAKREKILSQNPFDDYKVPRYQQTDRLYLIESELDEFVKLLDKRMNTSHAITLRYFLLGCFTGLRHSDWTTFERESVEGGFVKLRAKKNKKHIVVPIGKTLTRIIDEIDGLPKPFSNQKSNVFLKSLAGMAQVDKEITTHTGRHTFGYMCANNGLPEGVTAALLGVSAQTVKVYYHLTGESIKQQSKVLINI